MKRCRLCCAPLEGLVATFTRVLLRRHPSKNDPTLCHRCATKTKTQGAYICQICLRGVDEADALAHVKAEEYLLELIRRDHPEWKAQKATCPQCVDYYRQLISKTKI